MYNMAPYDDALRNILNYGERRANRTGIDTLSIFMISSTYYIDKRFPLMTRRKMSTKAVFAELLWMLSGSTHNEDLKKLGANFWTPWCDLANKDNIKFYEKTGIKEGYFGPIYGHQLRHFGSSYMKYMETENYEGNNGFDQIQWLVNEIKINPTSRRLVVSMWNPADVSLMRLPPCHYSFQIDVDPMKRMTLLMNQRSCDFPVGVPINIAFYATLCYMLAAQTGCTPYRFIHNTADSHIYINQIDAVKKYLDRDAPESPTLKLKGKDNIFDYEINDFEIQNYNPQSSIQIPVAV